MDFEEGFKRLTKLGWIRDPYGRTENQYCHGRRGGHDFDSLVFPLSSRHKITTSVTVEESTPTVRLIVLCLQEFLGRK